MEQEGLGKVKVQERNKFNRLTNVFGVGCRPRGQPGGLSCYIAEIGTPCWVHVFIQNWYLNLLNKGNVLNE